MKARIPLLAAFLSVLFVSSILADETRRETRTVESKGVERLLVECEFGAGSLRIMPSGFSDVARLEVEYTPRSVDFSVDFDTRGDVGHLTLTSDIESRHLDDIENSWDLELSTQYPMELEIEIGACEAEIDLGGIPISLFSLSVGAASGSIDFSSENPEVMDEFEIEVGASSLEMENLLNSNFRSMTFEGGAASCELGFQGELKHDAEVELEIGVGSVDIIIPKGIAVRIESDKSWFSSVDFHGMRLVRVDDGIYESVDFDEAENHLFFSIEVGMGAVDFYSKR